MSLGQGTLEKSKIKQEDDEIGMSYEFVWGVEASFGNFMPLRIVIENPLKNDRGVLTVRNGAYESRTPVELPSQSIRSFIIYVPAVDNGDAEIQFSCNQTNIRAPLPSVGRVFGDDYAIGLISDTTSLLAFLRSAPIRLPQDISQNQKSAYSEPISVQDLACLPGKAPDRAIGYDGLDIVVLGEGAERLTDVEVQAIQKYVLTGGRILFYGGAVSPILRDPRWAAFLPGTDPQVKNIDVSTILTKIIGEKVIGELTVTSLTPNLGTFSRSEQGVAMTISKGVGLGEVIYWAFDPFQSPVRDLKLRKNLFGSIFSDDKSIDKVFLQSQGVLSMDNDYYGYAYYPSEQLGPSGAFQVTMPNTGTIFFVLASYFLVVVPLNFVVLARMKKGHLAWITSPLIGLVFASVFFFIARGLYGNTLSRATKAVVVAHQGVSHAYVIGKQETFFPQGGRYDLGLKGVEMMTSSSLYGYRNFNNNAETGFVQDTVDIGEVVAPNAAVSNLAFREVNYRQSIEFPFLLPLDINVKKNKNSYSIAGTLYNDSPYTLIEPELYIGKFAATLPDIKPGETVSIDGLLNMRAKQEQLSTYERYQDMAPGFNAHYSGVTLVTRAAGLNSGAIIGKEEGKPPLLIYSYNGVSGVAK